MIIPLRIRVISKNRTNEPHRADPNSFSDLKVEKMTTNSTDYNQVDSSSHSRRSLLKQATAMSGMAALSRYFPGDLIANEISSESHPLTVEKIVRTSIRIPFRPIAARNMARELPHWEYFDIFELIRWFFWGPNRKRLPVEFTTLNCHAASDFKRIGTCLTLRPGPSYRRRLYRQNFVRKVLGRTGPEPPYTRCWAHGSGF